MMTSLLTGSATAERLGISHARVRQLAAAGTLRTHLLTPLGRFFSPAEVARFARKRERDRRVQTWRQKKNVP